MLRKIKQFLFLMVMFLMFQLPVLADGSTSIWASASNVTKGKTVTISVNTKNVGGVFNITSSDSSVLSGGVTGEWLDENKTYTYTFTAKNTGKATITITPVDAATTDAEPITYTTSKSVTLNVVAKSSSSSNSGTTADKKEYSSDNNLSKLEVEGYSIVPEFNKDVTEYKLTVDQNVEKIKINASANHKKASVNGAGEVNLSLGENTIEVKVTAENGNEKKYKIIVTVADLNPIKINIGEDEYTVVRKNNDLIEKMEYYEEGTTKINEQDVVAYTNAKTNTTLVLLKDKDNKINYYIYDIKNNKYELYKYIKVNNITLQLLNAPEELNGYKRFETSINEQAVDIYKLNKKNKIGLIYGVNVVSGNESFYQYDEEEITLSKYYGEEISLYKEEVIKYKKYLVISIGVTALVVIITILCSIIKSKKRRAMRKF